MSASKVIKIDLTFSMAALSAGPAEATEAKVVKTGFIFYMALAFETCGTILVMWLVNYKNDEAPPSNSSNNL